MQSLHHNLSDILQTQQRVDYKEAYEKLLSKVQEEEEKNKFEKYSFDAIKKKQVFKLFLYNYYSYLRNKN